MRILICISGRSGIVATQFELKMAGIAGKRIAGVCWDVAALESELRKPWGLYDLVILFAATGEELEQFVSLEELLDGIPVLLVLMEDSHDVLKMAHRLHPRYISVAKEGFDDVAAVLEKMIVNREEAVM